MCGVVALSKFCFFFKQKTAYEMRISDWSSDVCSSDLIAISIPRVDWKPLKGCLELQSTSRLTEPLPLGGAGVCKESSAFTKHRSEERRVGKACVSTCRSRWSPYN